MLLDLEALASGSRSTTASHSKKFSSVQFWKFIEEIKLGTKENLSGHSQLFSIHWRLAAAQAAATAAATAAAALASVDL